MTRLPIAATRRHDFGQLHISPYVTDPATIQASLQGLEGALVTERSIRLTGNEAEHTMRQMDRRLAREHRPELPST